MEFTLRYYKTQPLVIIIIVLASAIDLIIANLMIPLLECLNNENSLGENFYVIRAPTNTALIVSILALYDNYLWKYGIFKLLVNVPNLNGRYKGVLNSSFTDKPIYTYAEIKQTASKIKIQFYFKDGNNQETSSKSLIENIELADDGFYRLYLFYLNTGTTGNGNLDCHEGANVLKYIPENNKGSNKKPAELIGHYFTNRKPCQTRGNLKYEFEDKQRKGYY